MKKYIRILGSAILLGVIVWRLDWRHVAEAFQRVQIGYFLLAVLLFVLVQVVSSLRWRMLAQAQGFDGPPLRYVAYYFIGMFFNLALPSSVGGDVVRVWYLAGQQGTGPTTGRRLAATVSVLADRVNGVVVLVLLACVAAILCPFPLRAWIVWTVVAVAGVTIAGLVAVPALRAVFGKYPALANSQRLVHLRRLVDGAWIYRERPGVTLIITLLSVGVQVGGAAVGYLIGEALGLPVPALYYGLIIPLVALLTLAPISLNGMGLRETGFMVLLAPLGIEAADAVTFSLLLFASSAVVSLGGMGFYLLGRYPRYQAATVAKEERPLAA